MKLITLLSTFFLLAGNLLAEEKQFSIFLKRASFVYTPAEYYTSIDRFNSVFFTATGERQGIVGRPQNNRKIVNPISLSYYNASYNLFLEFSHYKIQLPDVYYTYPNFNYYGDYITLSQITRRESKLNAYTKSSFSEKHIFYYGLGIRNLYRENSEPDGLVRRSDSSDTYGLQAFLKYKWQFHPSWEIGLSLEPFYTYGDRKQKGIMARSYITHYQVGNTYVPTYSYYYNYRGPNQKTYFYGGEIDFQIGFRLSENWKLFVGYDYTYTKIRYENHRNFDVWAYPELSRVSLPTTSNFIKTKDHIHNYYIGIKAEF